MIFNREFNFVCRSMLQRLERFDTEDACGRWNSLLQSSVTSDAKLFLAMDILNEHAAKQCGQFLVPDGLLVMAIRIALCESLTIDFLINSLSGPNGFSNAPARFEVTVARDAGHIATARFRCGVGDSEGAFWYANTMKRSVMWVSDDYDAWAFERTKHFTKPTIAAWLQGPRDHRSQ